MAVIVVLSEESARKIWPAICLVRVAPYPLVFSGGVIQRFGQTNKLMQYFLEQFGVTVSAITGVLAARGKQVDLFGVIVLALVTALGGGTLRDVILAHGPVFWTQDSIYLINAAITAVVAFYLVRFHEMPTTALMVSDAFALALFTIIGTRKGLAFEGGSAIAVAMGVITGVAGGILRDLLTGQIPLVFQRQIYLYATAAFFGASFFVLLNRWSPDPKLNMIFGTTVTLLLRLAGIRWRITLPMFRPKNREEQPRIRTETSTRQEAEG